jgi:hypothetical protein
VFGRGVRLDKDNPGKRLIFIDHSQTAADLGLPTEIFHSELCDGTKRSASIRKREREEREERLPWECPMCGRLNDANIRKCGDSACDYSTAPRSKVQYAPGELVSIHGRPKQIDLWEKQLWYSQLLWVQDKRRYNDKWAFAKFVHKFGESPRGLKPIRTAASAEVLSYVKAGMIRWANSRRNPSNWRASA